MNLWLVGFIISWITFFILIDYKRILPNILAGIAALAAQITIDSTGGTLGLYLINYELVKVCHSSMFFTYGPVLTMGTLFAQYYPRETHLKLINIVVWTLLFALFEYTVHTNNYLIYTNWSIVDSIELDLVVITALSYVCEILIHPREREREKIV